MKWTLAPFAALLFTYSPRLEAQVTLSSAVNAASYLNPTLPNGSLAEGVVFVAFGQNLGPAKLAEISAFPLPTNLSGTSITATVGGTMVKCIMLYTSASQVAAVLPSNTPVGKGTLVATYNNVSSAPLNITVVAHDFGIFAVNQGGSGAGVFTNAITNVVNSPTAAANPGDLVDIWGTGIAPVSGNEANGPLPGNIPNLNVQVFVGGQSAQVQYAGRSGCCTGLDQIQISIPSGVYGCSVPVYLLVGGLASNFVTMSIAESGSTCTDPNAYSAALLATAQKNGGLRAGSAGISHLQGYSEKVNSVGDSVGLLFEKVPVAALQLGGPRPQAGSCYVTVFPSNTAYPTSSPLKAGTVTMTGPIGPYTLTLEQPGTYGIAFVPNPAVPDSATLITDGTLMKPGSYTFTATAGGDVGAFSVMVPLPTPMQWTNRPQVPATVNRSQGLNITWTNGYPGALVNMVGQSQVSVGVGASFMCWADASAGSFTVPAGVLSALPPTYSFQGNPQGSLAVYQVFLGPQFTAPGIDIGTTQSSDGYDIGPVTYQ